MSAVDTEDAFERLRRREGVWLRGAPGSGRSHALRQLAQRWPGEVLWIRDPHQPWLATLPRSTLLCIDDAPEGLDREALPSDRPVLAAGPRPGAGWSAVDLLPLPEDESVRLFLQHAPATGSMTALRALVRRLRGSPTAIIAAARRWPVESVESILADPSPGWPGLRAAYDALSGIERDTLALLCRLPGPARRAGLEWCGRSRGVEGLVTTGWVTVKTPGRFTLSPALAESVRGWQGGDVAPYLSWFAAEARRRFEEWDQRGGSVAWFRSGLWPALYAQRRYEREEWFFQSWLLSGESPEALLSAIAATGDAMPALIAARCSAQAHQRLGARQEAVEILRAAVDRGDPERPRAAAMAQLELAIAHHRLRDLDTAEAAYASALQQLDALGLRRDRILCLGNMAACAHARGEHAQARAGYREAIAEATALDQLRTRSHLASNLGSLLLELDELDAARDAFQQAVGSLSADRDARILAVTRANQGVMELLEGHLDAADTKFQEALALYSAKSPSAAALCHARRGAVAALRGQLDLARQHHERAEATAPPGDPSTTRLVALWRSILEWQAGDRHSALERRRASLHGEPPLTSTSGEARLTVRLLEQLSAQPGEVLLVGPGGAWFRFPGEEQVSVDRYTAVTRILAHLAHEAENSPGSFSDADALIAAGWPDEKIALDAARNRLAVALARLRKLGMRSLLQRAREGWRLDPDFSVLLLQSNALAEDHEPS